MEYPIFDFPLLGGSLLIATVAIFHTFIAHFSIGAGFYVAFAERRAIRENDGEMLAFLKKYTLAILLVPYVIGTVSGVGIWFTIALVSPRAVSVLIHQFVWGWATEWVLFLIEVTAIHVYYFSWGRVDAKSHNKIAWIFAVSSVLTLWIINGILSFMLTPGSWAPHAPWAFWIGLLNPSYLPTSLIRVIACFALAGTMAIVLATFLRGVGGAVREKVVSLAYKMLLPAALVFPLAGWTYATLSERAQAFLRGAAPVMMIFLAFGMASLAILVVASLLSMIRRDYSVSTLGSAILTLLAFVGFGSFEFVREGVRKPYVIEGLMYSTGVTTAAAEAIDSRANLKITRVAGVLAAAPWALPAGAKPADLDPVARGQCVYKAACLRCHSIDGYNSARSLLRGWTQPTIRHLLDRLDEIKSPMPPFPGTEAEKEALAEYLVTLNR